MASSSQGNQDRNPAKRPRTDGDNPLAIVVAKRGGDGDDHSTVSDAGDGFRLVEREIKLVELEIVPNYLKRLRDRKELGYRRPFGRRRLDFRTYEIVPEQFRYQIDMTIRSALLIRYATHLNMRATEIAAEIDEIAPLVVSACMTALYAKLRSIHRAYGTHAARYGTPPIYTKDVEIPLPFALAIQEFGCFESHSCVTNHLYAPTFPEGVQNEGRAQQQFDLPGYLSFVPVMKSLGIPCKSVDTRIKTGSAWWTSRVVVFNRTIDFNRILPRSHYSDFSANLRLLFTNLNEEGGIDDIVTPRPVDTIYGSNVREAPLNSSVRTFLALCHGPDEEWSFGAR